MLSKENGAPNTELEPVVRHIVAFMFVQDKTEFVEGTSEFRKGATDDDIAEIDRRFRDLKYKIPGIISIESSANDNPENLSQGYRRTWLVTFKSRADRDVYLNHPEHVKFKEFAGPFISVAFVYDIYDDTAGAKI
jgi:hypothetical protein